ncbi:MAG: S46 family peptidase [Opitutae bacterium]|nr:S46 family peptidase [Opitutae bacterium]
MKSARRAALALPVLVAGLLAVHAARADDGMWLLNRAPLADLKQKYGFEPAPAWLEHVQKSAVRFNSGGSGSFASADGLVITNHHVAADALFKFSTAEHNYLRDGFYAKTRAEEIKCVDLELNVLMDAEDVTAQVNAAVRPGMSAAEAAEARNGAKAALEQESLGKTGLRSDIVTLFQGAQYHLYRYKRYTDVRLVFAPEQQAAFFGGDPDNFEFPRFNLDIAIFRVYEHDRPVHVEHFLKWNPAGTQEGDLVFLAGHPGTTQRLITLAEMEYARDTQLPAMLRWYKSREVLFNVYGRRAEENARRAHADLLRLENYRKVFDGYIDGLLDPAVIGAKRAEEDALRKFAADHPELAATDAWRQIADAQQIIAQHAVRAQLLAGYNYNKGFNSAAFTPGSLLGLARTLFRAPTEFAKPDRERFEEFHEAGRTALELGVFSAKPIYDDYETVVLTNYLTALAMELGASDPVVLAALGGQAPSVRAAALVHGTRLKDIAFRRQLWAMTPAQVAQVDDPLIAFVRVLDAESRRARGAIEQQLEVKTQAHTRIAQVRFAKDGDRTAPDATFTLRLSYGTVKGYAQGGQHIAPYTTLAGTYRRAAEHHDAPPFDLPPSWPGAKAKLNLDTPYDFVSTCYCIGGNSGSPTINRAGEFIGIVFDGNIQSLIWNYAYTDTQARALSTDVRAIIETMRKVYGADALVQELLGGQ